MSRVPRVQEELEFDADVVVPDGGQSRHLNCIRAYPVGDEISFFEEGH